MHQVVGDVVTAPDESGRASPIGDGARNVPDEIDDEEKGNEKPPADLGKMRQSGNTGNGESDRPFEPDEPGGGSGVEEIPGIHKSPRTPGVEHSHLSYGEGRSAPREISD